MNAQLSKLYVQVSFAGVFMVASGRIFQAIFPPIGNYVHWAGVAVGFLAPLVGVADAIHPAMFGTLSEFGENAHPLKRVGAGLALLGVTAYGANVFVRTIVVQSAPLADIVLWSAIVLVVVGSLVLYLSLFKE